MSEQELRQELERQRRENEMLRKERREHEQEHWNKLHEKMDRFLDEARETKSRLASHSGQLEVIQLQAEAHAQLLHGTPAREHKDGLLYRFGNMEDSHRAHKKALFAVAIAAFGAAAEAIWAKLIGK